MMGYGNNFIHYHIEIVAFLNLWNLYHFSTIVQHSSTPPSPPLSRGGTRILLFRLKLVLQMKPPPSRSDVDCDRSLGFKPLRELFAYWINPRYSIIFLSNTANRDRYACGDGEDRYLARDGCVQGCHA